MEVVVSAVTFITVAAIVTRFAVTLEGAWYLLTVSLSTRVGVAMGHCNGYQEGVSRCKYYSTNAFMNPIML